MLQATESVCAVSLRASQTFLNATLQYICHSACNTFSPSGNCCPQNSCNYFGLIDVLYNKVIYTSLLVPLDIIQLMHSLNTSSLPNTPASRRPTSLMILTGNRCSAAKLVEWDHLKTTTSECSKLKHWMTEATRISRRPSNTINWDEGAHTLSHTLSHTLGFTPAAGETVVMMLAHGILAHNKLKEIAKRDRKETTKRSSMQLKPCLIDLLQLFWTVEKLADVCLNKCILVTARLCNLFSFDFYHCVLCPSWLLHFFLLLYCFYCFSCRLFSFSRWKK